MFVYLCLLANTSYDMRRSTLRCVFVDSVLVSKANRWLRQFDSYELVSCETVDKKVTYVKDIYSAAMYFMEEDGPILATHIKGLR